MSGSDSPDSNPEDDTDDDSDSSVASQNGDRSKLRKKGPLAVNAENYRRIGGRPALTYVEVDRHHPLAHQRRDHHAQAPLPPTTAPIQGTPPSSPGVEARPGLATLVGILGAAQSLSASAISQSARYELLSAPIHESDARRLPSYRADAPLILPSSYLGARPKTKNRAAQPAWSYVGTVQVLGLPAEFAKWVSSSSTSPCLQYPQHARGERTWRRGHRVDLYRFLTNSLFAGLFAQKHDYAVQKYETCSAVELRMAGPLGDQYLNPAHRVPSLSWHPTITKRQIKAWESAPFDDMPACFKVHYKCSGACMKWPRDDGKKGYQSVYVRGSGQERRCETRLKVIIYANSLTSASIYQLHDHEGREGHPLALDKAGALRAQARDLSERLGNTISSVKIAMESYTQKWEYDLNFQLPWFRRLRVNDIKNIFRAKALRNAQLGDPLATLSLLAETRQYDPEFDVGIRARGITLFHSYEPSFPLDLGRHSRSLVAMFAAASALDEMIRHSGKVIFMDSTHRGLNDKRAPLTIVCVQDDKAQLRPGPSLLSSDITADTLTTYLVTMKRDIESRARAVIRLHKDALPVGRDDDDVVRLHDKALLISRHGWKPAHIMIDKSRAELNAIQAFALRIGSPISVRICQFHAIQALLRWSTDSSSTRTPDSPKVPRLAKLGVLSAFRELQRFKVLRLDDETDEEYEARSEAEWDRKAGIFAKEIGIIVGHHIKSGKRQHTYDKIMKYFEDNWFTDTWRDLWTDNGLRAGESRDGVNTNNPAEATFAAFYKVMLNNRINHRIDHLGLIILDRWYLYYEEHDRINNSMDSGLIATYSRAVDLWEWGVIEVADAAEPRVYTVIRGRDQSLVSGCCPPHPVYPPLKDRTRLADSVVDTLTTRSYADELIVRRPNSRGPGYGGERDWMDGDDEVDEAGAGNPEEGGGDDEDDEDEPHGGPQSFDPASEFDMNRVQKGRPAVRVAMEPHRSHPSSQASDRVRPKSSLGNSGSHVQVVDAVFDTREADISKLRLREPNHKKRDEDAFSRKKGRPAAVKPHNSLSKQKDHDDLKAFNKKLKSASVGKKGTNVWQSGMPEDDSASESSSDSGEEKATENIDSVRPTCLTRSLPLNSPQPPTKTQAKAKAKASQAKTPAKTKSRPDVAAKGPLAKSKPAAGVGRTQKISSAKPARASSAKAPNAAPGDPAAPAAAAPATIGTAGRGAAGNRAALSRFLNREPPQASEPGRLPRELAPGVKPAKSTPSAGAAAQRSVKPLKVNFAVDVGTHEPPPRSEATTVLRSVPAEDGPIDLSREKTGSPPAPRVPQEPFNFGVYDRTDVAERAAYTASWRLERRDVLTITDARAQKRNIDISSLPFAQDRVFAFSTTSGGSIRVETLRRLVQDVWICDAIVNTVGGIVNISAGWTLSHTDAPLPYFVVHCFWAFSLNIEHPEQVIKWLQDRTPKVHDALGRSDAPAVPYAEYKVYSTSPSSFILQPDYLSCGVYVLKVFEAYAAASQRKLEEPDQPFNLSFDNLRGVDPAVLRTSLLDIILHVRLFSDLEPRKVLELDRDAQSGYRSPRKHSARVRRREARNHHKSQPSGGTTNSAAIAASPEALAVKPPRLPAGREDLASSALGRSRSSSPSSPKRSSGHISDSDADILDDFGHGGDDELDEGPLTDASDGEPELGASRSRGRSADSHVAGDSDAQGIEGSEDGRASDASGSEEGDQVAAGLTGSHRKPHTGLFACGFNRIGSPPRTERSARSKAAIAYFESSQSTDVPTLPSAAPIPTFTIAYPAVEQASPGCGLRFRSASSPEEEPYRAIRWARAASSPSEVQQGRNDSRECRAPQEASLAVAASGSSSDSHFGTGAARLEA
ncbi:hypothetical protein P7C70_g4573, partial [Phenoliferia sp. Uapishka_3]